MIQFGGKKIIDAYYGNIQVKYLYYNGTLIDIRTVPYTDLGLTSGTLWAKCNLGASSPQEYGDYYQFGSIIPDTAGPTSIPLEDIQNSRYDTARAVLGEGWMMPNQAQCQELLDECVWEQYCLNDVIGWKVMSKTNRNNIFIPSKKLNVSTYAAEPVAAEYLDVLLSSTNGRINNAAPRVISLSGDCSLDGSYPSLAEFQGRAYCFIRPVVDPLYL